MISRRTIRIKVMQTLYTLSTIDDMGAPDKRTASRILDEKLEHVLDIFTASVLFCIRTAEYAVTDADNQASKYLKSNENHSISTKIATSELVTRVLANKSFNDRLKKSKIEGYINGEEVRKVYARLAKTPEYEAYCEAEGSGLAEDKAMFRFLWEDVMLKNEDLTSHFADEFPGWEDDSEMVGMLMDNFLKAGAKMDFVNLLAVSKREYAHELLHTVIDKEAHCLELITPKLNNWDKERVALIDMILIRMGLCELLYFPSIPTKVTINEFIDIAKQYSTLQSGQFVNGVLDNLLKDMVKENRIHKDDKAAK